MLLLLPRCFVTASHPVISVFYKYLSVLHKIQHSIYVFLFSCRDFLSLISFCLYFLPPPILVFWAPTLLSMVSPLPRLSQSIRPQSPVMFGAFVLTQIWLFWRCQGQLSIRWQRSREGERRRDTSLVIMILVSPQNIASMQSCTHTQVNMSPLTSNFRRECSENHVILVFIPLTQRPSFIAFV